MAGKEAVELAFSKKPIPRRYFDAACLDGEEASRRAFRVNTARKESAIIPPTAR